MKRFLILLLSISVSYFTYSQTPQLVCYQAVAANDQGAELIKSNIKVMMKILENASSGAAIFTEEHQVTTDEFGLFTIELGSKNPTDFAKIKWGSNKYFLQANVDAGSGYKLIGTTQIISVPYALNAGVAESAKTADVAKTASDDNDKDSKNELQALLVDPTAGTLKIVPQGTVGASDQIAFGDKDADPKNELQTLKFDSTTGVLGIYDASNVKNGEVNTRAGLFAQPGASSAYPQGIVGKYQFIKNTAIYTVPPNKTFYVTANGNPVGVPMQVEVLGIPYSIKSYATCPVLPTGTKISNSILTGFETDADAKIQAVLIDLKSPYQIPPNKTLFIKSGIGVGDFSLVIDDHLTSFYSVNSGTDLPAISGGPNGITVKNAIGVPSILTGYLIDMP